MTKIILSLLSILIICNAKAQDSSSVLFIGNSYTAYNNLPQLFKTLTENLGDAVYVDARTPGGTTFQGHAGNNATYQKIEENPWHYVVFQAQSQEPSFPDGQVDANTLPYAQQMADSVYANNFCSQVMYYMTWGRKNGDPQWAPISTYEGMQTRLRNAYVRFADSTEGSVSPVGMAWKYIRETQPNLELYTADESHPSYAGSYLAACTFYASVFKKSPVGSTFYGSLSAQDAGFLQEAAELAVLHPDSLATFFLRENPTVANFQITSNSGGSINITNTSWRATDFLYYFGDGNTSTLENPSHTYGIQNQYVVTLEASSTCNLGTKDQTVEVLLGLGDEVDNYTLKSFSDNGYQISLPVSIGDWIIINELGQTIINGYTSSKSLNFDLTEEESGVYYLKLKKRTIKLLKQ